MRLTNNVVGNSTPGDWQQRGRDKLRQRDHVLITRVGLQLPTSITYEQWEHAGHQLSRVVDSGAWCLGDWIVFGESRYADRYKTAVENAGLDYQTLRNYAWVARKFPQSRRCERLSFQHHAEVAGLPESEQDRWLRQADRNGWSRNRLRKALREHRRAAVGTGVLPRIAVEHERIARWRAAAEAANVDLPAWIVASLDTAAETPTPAPGEQASGPAA